MNSSSFPFMAATICLIAIVLYRRFMPSRSTSTPRVDFIAQAAASIEEKDSDKHVAANVIGKDSDSPTKVQNSNDSESSDSFDDDTYNYDVVGESFQRDHLMSLIRSHKAFKTGEIYSTAILEMEPTNEFDPNAVKVIVEGTQVGYIPKFDSPAVTKMIKESGKKVYEVPARIGFDTESSQPLIGVKIALTVE
jgi:hypothetical protein